MANEYLKIRDIKFATTGKYDAASWFYSTLEADKVKYLTPQICYDGLVQASKKVTLFVKIFRPDGTLHDGVSSPNGYSYSHDVTISPGRNNYCVLSGWGTDNGGSYKPGIHRIEIWYDGKRIYSQDFTLTKHPHDIPSPKSNLAPWNEFASGYTDESLKSLKEAASNLFKPFKDS